MFSDGISAMKIKSLLFVTASASILATGCSSDRISGPDRIPAQMNKVYGSYEYGRWLCPSGYSHDTPGWCKKNVPPKIEFPRVLPEVKLRKDTPRHLGGFGVERFLFVGLVIMIFPAIVGIFIFLDKQSKKE